MLKKSNIKALIFAMIISIIITSLPMSVLAYDEYGDPYTTKVYVSGYGVKDGNDPLVPATTNQAAAINAMKEKARLSWTYGTSGSFPYHVKSENVDPQAILTIHFGQPYRGILYEQKGYSSSNSNNREHWLSTPNEITTAINISYTNNYKYIEGTDCSSSVSYAWREATGNTDSDNGLLMSTKGHVNNGDYYSTYDTRKYILDGNNNTSNNNDDYWYGAFVTRVGQYGVAASNLSLYEDNTKDIVTALTSYGNYQGDGTIHKRVYKNIQPGNFLVYRRPKQSDPTKMFGHVMLVKKVVIVYGQDSNLEEGEFEDGDGIDKNASYVLTNEQTSHWHECTNILSTGGTQEYTTTWILGYNGSYNNIPGIKYTFADLAKNYYLPYKLNDNYASMVTGFIPEQLSDTSVNVKWHPQNRSFCSGYILKYSTDPSFKDCETLIYNDPTKNECILKDLEKGEKYYIKMCAFNNKDGNTAYSGYNNWVSVDLSDGSLYRQNAPDPTKVPQQEYKQFVYDDISYDHGICDDI